MGILRKNLSAVVRTSRRPATEMASHEGHPVLAARLFEPDTTRTVLPSIIRLPNALPPPPREGDLVDWFHGKPSTPAGYAVRSGILDHCSPVDLFEVETELLAGGALPHYMRVLSAVSDGAEDAAWCARLGRDLGRYTHTHEVAVEALAASFRRTLSSLYPDRADVLRVAGAVLNVTEPLAEAVASLLDAEHEFIADGPSEATGPAQNLLGAPWPRGDLSRPCSLDRAVHIHLLGAVPLGEAMRQALWEFRTAQAVRVMGLDASLIVSARFEADPGAFFAALTAQPKGDVDV
ncbi:hypothetical protein [Nioella ostreopsis]|uniref:hypothetical protein n=1 Tax=Nioella ostreopsis TaxID=2448479 RepID=UPI000FD9FC10|nr:hypothetical protein [Nioella ostreopsis]